MCCAAKRASGTGEIEPHPDPTVAVVLKLIELLVGFVGALAVRISRYSSAGVSIGEKP